MEPTATAAPSLPRPLEEIRAEFPILGREVHGKPLAYLDNGATSQKPLAVIEAMDRFYREHNANVHRGVHTLSEEATAAYEGARRVVAGHIGADHREVIFVRNATEALNLVAYSWGRANLARGDRVLLTEMEHHSNIVPWYLAARETGAELDWAPITDEGRLDVDAFAKLLERGPKLVCLTHVSNVLGTVNPLAELSRLAHEAGALVVVDGAQAGPKLELDMAALGADFYALTAHKMYGPTGLGVLFGRLELLEQMPPFIGGGSMIHKVGRNEITWARLPAKFEGGTPAIAEAVGFAEAVRWLDERGARCGPRRRAGADRARDRAPGRGAGTAAVRAAGGVRSRRNPFVRARGRAPPRRLGDPRPPRRRRARRASLRPAADGAPRGPGDHPRQLRRLQHAR